MHGPTCIFWANLTTFSLKLLLGADGAPEVLYTGVCPPGKGLCYTHAQAVRGR